MTKTNSRILLITCSTAGQNPAVVHDLVAVEVPGEPHEAPGELVLGPDGLLLEYHLKSI